MLVDTGATNTIHHTNRYVKWKTSLTNNIATISGTGAIANVPRMGDMFFSIGSTKRVHRAIENKGNL